MDKLKLYNVETYSDSKIVFSSINDLEEAHNQINDGKDIYIVVGSEAIKLLNQDISPKIYDGTIKLAARLDRPLEEKWVLKL